MEKQQNVLVVGATSAIAKATARRLAERHAKMVLVALEKDQLSVVADDLTSRGGEVVETIQADLMDFDIHKDIIDTSISKLDKMDFGFFAQGILDKQEITQADYSAAEKALKLNFLSIISMLTPLANHMEEQKNGTIAVMSSVAGDKGRQSNYVYGTAKGALSIYLQGLRHRLFSSNVKVLTVKPGFVDTPMTAEFDKGPLFVKPETIANCIIKAFDKGKNGEIYTPFFWYVIMAIIRMLPDAVFHRTKL